MTNRKSFTPFLAPAAISLALLWIWTRFAELWIPSVAFYAGLVVFVTGLVSVAVPLRFLGVRARRAAALVALAGAVAGAAAVLWPVSADAQRAAGSTGLDRVLPEYDRNERHEMRVQGTLEQVRKAAAEVTFRDIRGLQTLMTLRAGKRVSAPPAPMLAAMTAPGAAFKLLARTDDEFVAGNIGRPWAGGRPAPVWNADEFRAYADPGYTKIAFNMRVQADEPGWCKVSTETRVLATDPAARTAFTRYWRVVYPGSALIRLMWLDAIQRRLVH
jgi:hypothetical protein